MTHAADFPLALVPHHVIGNQDSPEPGPALHPWKPAESKMAYSHFFPTSSLRIPDLRSRDAKTETGRGTERRLLWAGGAQSKGLKERKGETQERLTEERTESQS